MNSRIL